ncbi:hypothetical protein [Bdellovibrio bacteriovorus]|uniref:hypothetical protein n=1 Tax=Bdellovibrio TaxID=958 RepID=UPI0035A94758
MQILAFIFAIITITLSQEVFAQEMHDHNHKAMEHSSVPSLFCNPDESLDLLTGMCFRLANQEQTSEHFIIHGNLFLVGITQEGPRGEDRFAAPNMLMFDYQKSSQSRHTLNFNLMLTFEKWTYPKEGYPELLQIGEKNEDGEPYIDAQHPHSSPIMGLTISDTYRWNDSSKNHAKFFFAPRGQTTEGPIAFMHRNTGMVNPDAPLGHHIGQDVGHISSTVLGSALYLGKISFEISAFHGAEPEPDTVELRLGPLDSAATRVGYQLSEKMLGLISFAYINEPEHDETQIKFYRRYSASFYNEWAVSESWKAFNTLIYGRIENYNLIPNLSSITEEFAFNKKPMTFWGRIEVLQRAPIQLFVASENPDRPEWLTATTLGYTHHIASSKNLNFQVGLSVSKYFIPITFTDEYETDPWAGKVFIQVNGMK